MTIIADTNFINKTELSDEVFYKLVYIIKEIIHKKYNLPHDEILPWFEIKDKQEIAQTVCTILDIPYSEEIKNLRYTAKLANYIGRTTNEEKLSEKLNCLFPRELLELKFPQELENKKNGVEEDNIRKKLELFNILFFPLKIETGCILGTLICNQFELYIILKFLVGIIFIMFFLQAVLILSCLFDYSENRQDISGWISWLPASIITAILCFIHFYVLKLAFFLTGTLDLIGNLFK